MLCDSKRGCSSDSAHPAEPARPLFSCMSLTHSQSVLFFFPSLWKTKAYLAWSMVVFELIKEEWRREWVSDKEIVDTYYEEEVLSRVTACCSFPHAQLSLGRSVRSPFSASFQQHLHTRPGKKLTFSLFLCSHSSVSVNEKQIRLLNWLRLLWGLHSIPGASLLQTHRHTYTQTCVCVYECEGMCVSACGGASQSRSLERCSVATRMCSRMVLCARVSDSVISF